MLCFFHSPFHTTYWDYTEFETQRFWKLRSQAGIWKPETTAVLRESPRFWLLKGVVAIGFLFATFSVRNAVAGAVGSNWVVVVNGQSVTSRTIANHYCTARNIPGRNVIVLQSVPDSDQISVDQFRELILRPVLQEIEARRLAAHLQGIAYSADFPTAIAIGSDIDAVPNKSPYLTPVGSINGLTYLFRFVQAKNPNYIGFESNLYAARPVNQLLNGLVAHGEQAKQFADLISQAKQNLQSSIRADYSHPTGSFIFTKTDDVRTKTREPGFAMAISKLQSRGRRARVVEHELPPRGEECSGVMVGSPQFSWNQNGSKLLPGSIAENLTSLGGAMGEKRTA